MASSSQEVLKLIRVGEFTGATGILQENKLILSEVRVIFVVHNVCRRPNHNVIACFLFLVLYEGSIAVSKYRL